LAQRCVGIVIGPRKLKAVELISSFGELILNRYWLIDLPDYFRNALFGIAPGPEQGISIPDEFARVLSEDLELSISLPSELCFYREIELPFTDTKKINQVIRLEAEDYFPFELDEFLLEFLPPISQNHSSNVLTFALKRSSLSQVLSSLNTLGLDPAFSGIEGLTLPLLSINQPEINRLWLEIGTNRTILVGSSGALPFLYRRIPLGINALKDALIKQQVSSPEQAEQWILQTALYQDTEASQSPQARIISEWLDSILSKVNETLHWFERNRKDGSVLAKFEELIVAGNGALIKGIDRYMEQGLNLPCRKFQIPDWIKSEQELAEDKALVLAEPLSLALARVRREGRRLINFRKGEFAWKMEFQIPYRKMIFPAVLLVLILTLGIAKSYGQYSLNKQHKALIQKQMLGECQKLIPNCTDPLRQVTQALSTARAKTEAYRDLLYPSSIETLSAIADQLPEGTGFVLNRYSYSKDKARIEGETSDFASANAIKDQLSKVEFFKKVTLEDSRSTPNGKVNFSIQIELKSAGGKNGG